MADTVFPQENDGGSTADVITEQALGTSFAAFVGFRSTVADGLSLNADFVNDEVDISAGTSVIMSDGLGYIVSPDARTNLSLPAGDDTNHVFLSVNLANDDDISVHIDSDDTAPSDPSVKLGTVDTANNETTLLNRGSGGGGLDIEENGSVVTSGASALNFGPDVTAVDDGDGTATVLGVDTRINVDNSGTRAATEPTTVNFGSGLSASGTGGGDVDVTATASGGSSGFNDSGSRILLAAGTDSDTYSLPVYVPDSQTATIDFLGLSLSDESTDTNVKLQLVDPTGTVAGSQSLDSHPIRDTNPSISYENTSGSAQVATIELVNEGGTDYAPTSTAADYVEFALQWSVA